MRISQSMVRVDAIVMGVADAGASALGKAALQGLILVRVVA